MSFENNNLDIVGLGKVNITLKLEGLETSDLRNIERVIVKIIEPDGKVIEKKGLFNPKLGEVYITHTVLKEGIHKVSATVYYYDGSWNTSYNTYKFYATTHWNEP
jgi:hypothetical protein